MSKQIRPILAALLAVGVTLATPSIAGAQDAPEATPKADRERPAAVVARVLQAAEASGALEARVLGERHFLVARSRAGEPDRSVIRVALAKREGGGWQLDCAVTERLDAPPVRTESMAYVIDADGALRSLRVERSRGMVRFLVTGERMASGAFRVDGERRVDAVGEVESAEIPADEVHERLPWPLVRFVLPLLVDQGLPERLPLFETHTFLEGQSAVLAVGPTRGGLWGLELSPQAGADGTRLAFRVDLTGTRGSLSIRENVVIEGPGMHDEGAALIKKISKAAHDAMIEDASAGK